MGDEDEHPWQPVRRRNRQEKGKHPYTPDIVTTKNLRQENYANLTTYFFTAFPNSFGAKAMFNAFQYYGDIVEVVIPAKRDKGGRRFGFARFDHVSDAYRLEYELDNIIVGRDKISVNLSRFHRPDTIRRLQGRKETTKAAGSVLRTGVRQGEVNGIQKTQSTIPSRKQDEKNSYAHAVSTGINQTEGRTRNQVVVNYEATKEDMARLQRSFIGEVLHPGMSYNIQEAFHRQGYFGVKVTPLGSKLTLLEGQDEGEVQALMEDAKGWLDQWFKEIRQWNPKEIDIERVVWLRIYGIPSHAWNDLFFDQLTKPWGVYMNADDGTMKRTTMDVARLMIRTTCQQPVDEFVDVKVNGELFHLRILEDSYGPMRILIPKPCGTNGRDDDGNSTEEEEGEEEEVEGNRLFVEEDVAEGEPEENHENSLAPPHVVNTIIDQDNLSTTVLVGPKEREHDNEGVLMIGNPLAIEVVGYTEGSVEKENRMMVNGGFSIGREEVVGGSIDSINNQQSITGGMESRMILSDVAGPVLQPVQSFNPQGSALLKQGGVYSDGPRSVYLKLNKGHLQYSNNRQPTKQFPARVHPIPANIRKQQKLIHNLHLRTSTPCSSQQVAKSTFSDPEVDSRQNQIGEERAHRNPPYRHKPRKQQENSISSAGAVLCCSSLHSSDIRNCNKRFVDNFNHEAAKKVWQGATELGVVGDEEVESYVQRIINNENKEDEARILREQQHISKP
jgi:hypothetical protein